MRRAVLIAGFLMAFAAPARAAADDPLNTQQGIAIDGYDVVAYFREGRARHGSARYAYIWNRTIWLFEAPANRDAFAAEPERFVPRYGGFSAHGMARGDIYPVDPHAFQIVDDKLYLHANHHVKRVFGEDLASNIARADAHWRDVVERWQR